MRNIKTFEQVVNFEDNPEFTGDVYNYNCEGMIYLMAEPIGVNIIYQPSILVERHSRSDYLVFEHSSFHVKVITYEAPVTPIKEAYKKVPKIVLSLVEDMKEYIETHNKHSDKLQKIVDYWYNEIPELGMLDATHKYNL